MKRIILIVAIAIGFAASLSAQDAAPFATSFLIERIEVRNARRVSPDVVIAESRLREGQEYSEEELSDASNRLSRLPFLLSAEFSLEKGTERGQHVLVITINETKPFFYALEARPIIDHVGPGFDYSDRIGTGNSEAALGFRFFVGRRGAIHIGLIGADIDHDYVDNYSSFAVGYTQYDLFGTRAFATLNIRQVFGGYSSGSSRKTAISPELVVGVPLSPNQTVTVQVSNTRLGESERTVRVPLLPGQTPEGPGEVRVATDDSQRLISSTWSYNTTNHPFFPTRGTVLVVSPLVSWNDSSSYRFESEDGTTVRFVPTTDHSRVDSLKISGARYWEISERRSISAGGESSYARLDNRSSNLGDHEIHAWRAVVQTGISHSLWDPSRAKDGDSRLELTLRAGIGEREVVDTFHPEGRDDSLEFQQISGSWIRRSSWGSLRLGLGYAW